MAAFSVTPYRRIQGDPSNCRLQSLAADSIGRLPETRERLDYGFGVQPRRMVDWITPHSFAEVLARNAEGIVVRIRFPQTADPGTAGERANP